MLTRFGIDPDRPFPQLVRLFVGRFFDNDLVSPHAESQVTITQILAILALPGFIVPFYLMPRYVKLHFDAPHLTPLALTVDRSFFVILATVVMGFVTALEWDALFPDARDYRVLTPLPLSMRSLFGAKFAALLGFLALFSIDINVLACVLFPAVTAAPREPALHTLALGFIHAIAVLGASAFIFFFCVALEGTLLCLVPPRWYPRVSTCAQFTLMACLLALFLLFPLISTRLHLWKDAGATALYLLPPMWFLGWYEAAAGSTHPVFLSLAAMAPRALAAAVGLAVLTFLAAYRMHLQRSLETRGAGTAKPTRAGAALVALLYRLFLQHPVEQAVFAFAGKTLARSRKHTLYLAAYVGVGFAFVLEAAVGLLAGEGAAGFGKPGPVLLSVPLVLSFFLLSGLRVIFTIPSELKANWIFRISETEARLRCLAGARKVIIVFAIAPLTVLTVFLYLALWGWREALLHLSFPVLLSLLLMDLMLAGFRKVPFACSYQPGKAKLTEKWVLYWIAFSLYAYSMAHLEMWLAARPVRLLIFFAALLFVWRMLIRWRDEGFRDDSALVYVDEADPSIQVLNLPELTRL